LESSEAKKDIQLITDIIEKHKELTDVLLAMPYIFETFFM